MEARNEMDRCVVIHFLKERGPEKRFFPAPQAAARGVRETYSRPLLVRHKFGKYIQLVSSTIFGLGQ